MKFDSQVCTSRLQSEQLIALGLKKETADCIWCEVRTLTKGNPIQWYLLAEHINKHDEKHIPAWSLHRLIEIAQLPQSWQCLSGDWYSEVIAHIQSMIHINQFNKEYLEE